jgi:hypothetical protein
VCFTLCVLLLSRHPFRQARTTSLHVVKAPFLNVTPRRQFYVQQLHQHEVRRRPQKHSFNLPRGHLHNKLKLYAAAHPLNHTNRTRLIAQNLMRSSDIGACPHHAIYSETNTMGQFKLCSLGGGDHFSAQAAEVRLLGRTSGACAFLPAILNGLQQEGRKVPLLIDVSAGVGICTLYATCVYPPQANFSEPLQPRVISLEPISESFQLLRYNVALNKLNHRVSTFHVALRTHNIEPDVIDQHSTSSRPDDELQVQH